MRCANAASIRSTIRRRSMNSTRSFWVRPFISLLNYNLFARRFLIEQVDSSRTFIKHPWDIRWTISVKNWKKLRLINVCTLQRCAHSSRVSRSTCTIPTLKSATRSLVQWQPHWMEEASWLGITVSGGIFPSRCVIFWKASSSSGRLWRNVLPSQYMSSSCLNSA